MKLTVMTFTKNWKEAIMKKSEFKFNMGETLIRKKISFIDNFCFNSEILRIEVRLELVFIFDQFLHFLVFNLLM